MCSVTCNSRYSPVCTKETLSLRLPRDQYRAAIMWKPSFNQAPSWPRGWSPGDKRLRELSEVYRQEIEQNDGYRVQDSCGFEDGKAKLGVESGNTETRHRYSRYSRTLSPGTALVVRLDVRLHAILHHAANRARHHISAPVPIEAGKRKWQMNECVMAIG